MRLASAALSVGLAISLAAPLAAQGKPIQLALVTPIQIVPEKEAVTAVRLNLIYSVNHSVQYVDLGLVNVTDGGPSSGVQWAFVAINKGAFTGWQSAFAAVTQARFEGLQTGVFSSAREGQGLQWSGVNMSDNWKGLQLGLVNYAKRTSGVQVGIVNIIKEGGQFPVFPIVNWGKGKGK
jgi:hypothetical protein